MTGPAVLGHTEVIHHPDGSVSTRRYGPGHVVPGSVRVIDVPAGVTVVVRHLDGGPAAAGGHSPGAESAAGADG